METETQTVRLSFPRPDGAAATAIGYFVIALISAIAMAALLPPFQMPDEHQHFFRAFQIAEARTIISSGGALGAELPDSLGEMVDRLLGARELHAKRWISIPALPLRETLAELSRPLDPQRRNFVDFTGAAVYPPYVYAPQAGAVWIARACGAGPLAMFYAARLGNALVAAGLMAFAISLFPFRRPVLAAFGLMPMVLALFGSVSPDAILIAGATLLASVMLRWSVSKQYGVSQYLWIALLGGAICAFKPVYGPMLLLGFPTRLNIHGVGRAALAYAGLVLVAILSTAAWVGWLAPHTSMTAPNTDPSGQVAYLMAHPFRWFDVMINTAFIQGADLGMGFVAFFGWLTVKLPLFGYGLAFIDLVAVATLLRKDPAAPRMEAAWALALFAGVYVLTATALYVGWTQVGFGYARGIQGRYLLPGLGLLATAASITPHSAQANSRGRQVTALVLSCALIVVALVTISQAYGVFR